MLSSLAAFVDDLPAMPASWWVTLPLWTWLLLHGCVIAHHDLRSQRIRNRHILLTLAAAAVWHGWMLLDASRLAIAYDPWATALNGFLGLMTAFGMYVANLWSPADAKWFAALNLALPLWVYQPAAIDYFPGLTLLINAYVCAFAYIAGEFALRMGRGTATEVRLLARMDGSARQERLYALLSRAADAMPRFFVMAVGVAFVMVLLRLVMLKGQQVIGPYVHLKPATIFLILFLLFNPLYRLMRIKWIFAPALFGLLTWVGSVIVSQDNPDKVKELFSIGVLSISLILFRELYNLWQAGVETRWIEVDELSDRHILTDAAKTLLVEQKVMGAEALSEIGVDGLTRHQVIQIIHHFRHPQHHGFIEVQRTIPFGPFLFLGLVATLLSSGLLLHLPQRLLSLWR